jgi:hypothetical protein
MFGWQFRRSNQSFRPGKGFKGQFAPQQSRTGHVRLGSITTEMGFRVHVRFPPIAAELRTSLEVRSVPNNGSAIPRTPPNQADPNESKPL